MSVIRMLIRCLLSSELAYACVYAQVWKGGYNRLSDCVGVCGLLCTSGLFVVG